MKMLELNKIYNMDAIEFLEQIDDCSIDLIITDPPYNVGKEFEINIIDFKGFIRKIFQWSYTKLKVDRFLVYTCPTNQIDFWIEQTKFAGFKFERILFYYKKGKFTDVWISWLLTSEAILIFSKGNPNLMILDKDSKSNKKAMSRFLTSFPAIALLCSYNL